MIVVGTAGHIDHGKSSIVKRLTGSDPDRLPEEKKRGMTIDLGFAFYKDSDNDTIAFVDVPGHERFVKNMISGAAGIDAVMLVIAADDGWMPQTEEHFQIVRLLGVKHGLVVVNKSDLASASSIDALVSEIKNKLKNTFLSSAAVIVVSSSTGEGFDELQRHLDTMGKEISTRRDIEKARLYIDRVFMTQGIGAVVTGTLRDGVFNVGQTVTIWPSLEQSRIKSLQSNNQNVETAKPGQRTAVSLTGTGKSKLPRGSVITASSELRFLKNNSILAIKVELLKNSPIELSDRRRVLLLIGTTECEAEVRLIDGNKVHPGKSAIVLVKPDEPVYSMIGDHAILRLPTPMLTIGGGIVLDHLPQFPRKKDLAKLSYLNERTIVDLGALIINEINKSIAMKPNDVLQFSNFSKTEITAAIDQLVKSGKCGVENGFAVDSKMVRTISNQVLIQMTKLTSERGTAKGWTLEEICNDSELESEKQKVILDILVREQKLEKTEDRYFLKGVRETVLPAVQKAHNDILAKLNTNRFEPPILESLITDGRNSKDAIGLLIKNSEVYKCGSEFLFTRSAWDDILLFIRMKLSEQNKLAVGELRDKFEFSRKYAIPILEETDRMKITSRQGDVRVKGANFES